MKIRVEQEDFDQGLPGHCGACPIALAVMRAVPEAKAVDVTTFGIGILWHGHDKTSYYGLPSIAEHFIQDFDSGQAGDWQPFEFELEA